MVIANPIYDVVFKFLMEDERTAKFFISTLLEETIVHVAVKPQEHIYTDQMVGLAVFRLDCIATIKTEDQQTKKILIKIQKAANAFDLMRFRNYLIEQDKKEENVNGRKTSLPIVTIYLLGFSLPEIETPILKVNRQYIDLISHLVITQKSDFIEKLTHDCFVVQLGRIQGKVQTKLEKLLSIFEQNYFLEDNTLKEYHHPIDNEDIKRIVDSLHYVGTEPKEKKKIEDEKEAWRTFDALTGGMKEKVELLMKQLEQNKKALDDNKKELDNNKKELNDNKRELDDNKKELDDKDKLIEELKRKLGEK